MDPSPFPCMDPDEFARWEELNHRSVSAAQAVTPCADCTPAYRREQSLRRRCARRVAVALHRTVPAATSLAAGTVDPGSEMAT